jgi:hypothetical protein
MHQTPSSEHNPQLEETSGGIKQMTNQPAESFTSTKLLFLFTKKNYCSNVASCTISSKKMLLELPQLEP